MNLTESSGLITLHVQYTLFNFKYMYWYFEMFGITHTRFHKISRDSRFHFTSADQFIFIKIMQTEKLIYWQACSFLCQ